jgi:hypothetical protein
MNTYLNYKIKGINTQLKINDMTNVLKSISNILNKNIKDIKKENIKLIDNTNLQNIKIILDNGEYIELNYKENNRELRILIKLIGINDRYNLEEYIKKELNPININLEVNYSYK